MRTPRGPCVLVKKTSIWGIEFAVNRRAQVCLYSRTYQKSERAYVGFLSLWSHTPYHERSEKRCVHAYCTYLSAHTYYHDAHSVWTIMYGSVNIVLRIILRTIQWIWVHTSSISLPVRKLSVGFQCTQTSIRDFASIALSAIACSVGLCAKLLLPEHYYQCCRFRY